MSREELPGSVNTMEGTLVNLLRALPLAGLVLRYRSATSAVIRAAIIGQGDLFPARTLSRTSAAQFTTQTILDCWPTGLGTRICVPSGDTS